MSMKHWYFGTLGLVFSVCVLGLVLASSASFADEHHISNVSLSVPISCSISGALDTAHTATINNGTYQSEIGTTTFTVFCNDNNGFALYAAGYTGEEVGKTNSNKLVGVNTSATISTNKYIQGTTTDSTWAMKLIKVTDTSAAYNPANLTILSDANGSYDDYHAVPNTFTKVATFSSTTDLTLGSKLQATYSSYIAGNQLTDTYRGKVKYVLVHPVNEVPAQEIQTASGYIGYYPNTGIYEGSMSTSQGGPVQQLGTSQTSATLLATNFSKDGYGFAGWSDAYDYKTNPNAHFYGPNEDITFTAGQYTGSNPGLSLYAVWVKSEGYLQDSDTVVGLCGDGTAEHPGSLTQAIFTKDSSNESIWSITADLSSVSALTDKRDNQTYAIAKLSDGKCWMIENLRIEAEATRGSANEALSQGYGKYSGTGTNYGEFIGLANAESANFNSTAPTEANNNTNSIYSSDGSTEININSSGGPANRIPRYNHINTDSTPSTGTRATSLTASLTYTTTANANIYGYGNYYNWPAAKANTNYYATVASSDTVSTSICPAGWHLPTGSGSGEFGVLSNSLGGLKNGSDVAQTMSSSTSPTHTVMKQRLRHYPNNILYSGRFYVSSVQNKGTTWSYSSATTSNGSYYPLSISSSSFSPGIAVLTNYYGSSVRCIAD